MRIYIVTDVEGVSGVVRQDEQAHPGGVLYDEARRALTRETAAAVQGALDGGADEVVIFDMHCEGLNLHLDDLPSGTKVIVGKPGAAMLHAERLGPFDGLFLVGFHCRFGNPAGLLCHTYALYIRELFLNDRPIGEVELEAAAAGDLGIPVLMVTGDSAMEQEVGPFLPGTVFVSVKTPLSPTAALCSLPKDAAACIRDGAEQAVRQRGAVAPTRTALPVTLRVVLDGEEHTPGFLAAGFRRDGEHLVCTGPTVMAVYKALIAAILGGAAA